MPTTLWFARHGEVSPEYVGAFVGRLDVPLSDVGHHQAAAIDAFLNEAGIDAVLTSPRKRALSTAKPLSNSLEVDLDVRPMMAEMDFGEWEGLRWPEIEARDAGFAAEWQKDPASIPCPGGEAAGAFADRVQQELHAILEEFRNRNIVLFAHAGVNRAILADVLGVPYMQSFAMSQDYGCVNAAGWQEGLAQIALMNFVPGPRSAMQGDGERV